MFLLQRDSVEKAGLLGDAGTSSLPHILFILTDDFGWGEVPFTGDARRRAGARTLTPNLDALAANGVRLDRHYSFWVCTPSRVAIQSGRAPQHQGRQRSLVGMTPMAAMLQRAGYRTHMAGKWDAGPGTPYDRGYASTLAYFGHQIDYWSFANIDRASCNSSSEAYDLWYMGKDSPPPGAPARHLLNPPHCRQGDQNGCTFADELFENEVRSIISAHSAAEPLFLFWAIHSAHTPAGQLPRRYCTGSTCHSRAFRRAMTKFVDTSIGRVITTLRNRGLYKDTLIVFTSDNGGQKDHSSNYPLRGGKFTPWEGGIRQPTLVSGGFVPQEVRGSRQTGLSALWDWYATFARLAGVSMARERGAPVASRPEDSIDLWPLITNQAFPRKSITIAGPVHGRPIVVVIEPPFKLIVSLANGNKTSCAYWDGPSGSGRHRAGAPAALESQSSPSAKGHACPSRHQVCSQEVEGGCLYDIYADPREHVNLAAERPDQFTKMLKALRGVELSAGTEPMHCEFANGFLLPFK